MFISFILIFLGLILVALILPTSTTLPRLTTTGTSLIAATVAIAATLTASLVSRLNLHAIRVACLGSLADLCHQAADILQLVGG